MVTCRAGERLYESKKMLSILKDFYKESNEKHKKKSIYFISGFNAVQKEFRKLFSLSIVRELYVKDLFERLEKENSKYRGEFFHGFNEGLKELKIIFALESPRE